MQTSSATYKAQDWYDYTLAYFGMTQGEMSETEVQTLSTHLNNLSTAVITG
jgi:hypothetical protein